MEDEYVDMTINAELYDTIDYHKDHPLHSLKIKGTGETKNECARIPITEYVGLKPKVYSTETKTIHMK